MENNTVETTKSNRITLIKRDELANFIKENKYVIIKVSATWCKPCKSISDLVEQCFDKLIGAKMVYVDADVGFDIYSKLKIRQIPTLYSYIDGKPMDVVVGANNDEIVNLFVKLAGHMYN
jgi:putative thioredoxin